MNGIHPLHEPAHYYGDIVRRLFIAAVVVSAVALPIFGDVLPFGLLFELGGALTLIVLAGLTSPRGRQILFLDVLASALGVLLLEYTAIHFYGTDSMYLFLAREAEAVMLVFALYFSVKTLRSMTQGKIEA